MLCLKSDVLRTEQGISVQTSHISSADSLVASSHGFGRQQARPWGRTEMSPCHPGEPGTHNQRVEGFTTQASFDCISHIETCHKMSFEQKIPSLKMFENPHSRLSIAGKIIQVPKG